MSDTYSFGNADFSLNNDRVEIEQELEYGSAISSFHINEIDEVIDMLNTFKKDYRRNKRSVLESKIVELQNELNALSSSYLGALKIDDKVFVKDFDDPTWSIRYFAGLTCDGRPTAYTYGDKSDSKDPTTFPWYECIRWEDITDDMIIDDE
jgi:hypothetical protein